jgi:hypothetical protein
MTLTLEVRPDGKKVLTGTKQSGKPTANKDRRVDEQHTAVAAPHIPVKKKVKAEPWQHRIRITNGDEEDGIRPQTNNSRPAQSTAVPSKTKIQHENAAIPSLVRNDETRAKLWENATDEERAASELLCEFKTTTAKAGISAYFSFADRWNEAFPNKKAYDRGLGAVKKAAKIAQVSASTIYSVLKTTKFYGRNGYEALAKKAAGNSVVIEWTQLRVLANRLADNKEARTEIEREIVQRKVTESQLNEMIDRLAPETVQTRAGQKTKRSALSRVDALNTVLSKMLREKEGVLQTLDTVEAEYDGNTEQSEEIVKVCGRTIELLSDLVLAFGDYHDLLDKLVVTATQIINGASKTKAKQAVSEKAKKIRQQISNENTLAAEKEQARKERVQLMGDFADDGDEQRSRPAKRSVRRPVLDQLPDIDDSYNVNTDSVTKEKVEAVLADSDEGFDDEEFDGEPSDVEGEEDTRDHDEYNEEDNNDSDADYEYEDEGEDEDEDEDEEDAYYEDDDSGDDIDEDEGDEGDEGDEDDDDSDWDDDDFEVDDRDAVDIFDENGNIP